MYLKLDTIYTMDNGGTMKFGVFGLLKAEVDGIQKVPIGLKGRDSKIALKIESDDGRHMARFVVMKIVIRREIRKIETRKNNIVFCFWFVIFDLIY